jgi:hypothetical protein
VNYRRIAAAAATAWLVSIPVGAVIHHGVLGGVYAANAAPFRPDADVVHKLPIGYAFQLLGFSAVSFMYAETSPRSSNILRGIRFGLLIGVIVMSFAIVWNYITQPISALLGAVEAFECMFLSAVYGAIIGVISDPSSQQATGRHSRFEASVLRRRREIGRAAPGGAVSLGTGAQ